MRLFDLLLNGLAGIAACILLFVMFAIGADVTIRAFSDGSLVWVLEASEHALLAMLLLGMPWLARERGHIHIEFVTEKLAPRTRGHLTRVTSVFVALLLGWLAVWAARLSLADYRSGITTIGIYPIPRFVLSAAICASFLLTAAEYLRQAARGTPAPAPAATGAL